MARRDHRDPGVEIEEAVPVHVLDDRALAALRHQRIAPRIGRRNHRAVALDDGPRARSRKRTFDSEGPYGPTPSSAHDWLQCKLQLWGCKLRPRMAASLVKPKSPGREVDGVYAICLHLTPRLWPGACIGTEREHDTHPELVPFSLFAVAARFPPLRRPRPSGSVSTTRSRRSSATPVTASPRRSPGRPS